MTAPGRIRITCITRTGREAPWDRIESIGGVSPGGARWRLSVDDAVAWVESETCRFYVEQGDSTLDAIVATHSGHKHLKTAADSEQPDALLSLPECP